MNPPIPADPAPSVSRGMCSSSRPLRRREDHAAPRGARAPPRLRYSVSYTTRAPRAGEVYGATMCSSPRRIRGRHPRRSLGGMGPGARQLLRDLAEVLSQALAEGRDVLLDIDVQGARQILKRFSQSVTIFIMPLLCGNPRGAAALPGSGPAGGRTLRFATRARRWRRKRCYRHVIVNDDLPTAVRKLVAIIGSYRNVKTETLYGVHAVQEALAAGRRDLFEIYVDRSHAASGRLPSILAAAEARGIEIRQTDAAQMASLAGTPRTRGGRPRLRLQRADFRACSLPRAAERPFSGPGPDRGSPQSGRRLRHGAVRRREAVLFPRTVGPATPAVSRSPRGLSKSGSPR